MSHADKKLIRACGVVLCLISWIPVALTSDSASQSALKELKGKDYETARTQVLSVLEVMREKLDRAEKDSRYSSDASALKVMLQFPVSSLTERHMKLWKWLKSGRATEARLSTGEFDRFEICLSDDFERKYQEDPLPLEVSMIGWSAKFYITQTLPVNSQTNSYFAQDSYPLFHMYLYLWVTDNRTPIQNAWLNELFTAGQEGKESAIWREFVGISTRRDYDLMDQFLMYTQSLPDSLETRHLRSIYDSLLAPTTQAVLEINEGVSEFLNGNALTAEGAITVGKAMITAQTLLALSEQINHKTQIAIQRMEELPVQAQLDSELILVKWSQQNWKILYGQLKADTADILNRPEVQAIFGF